jgi:hypothetical protein
MPERAHRVWRGRATPGATSRRDAALPENAEFTGFSSETGELWFVPGDQEPCAYVVSDDHVEAWPRTNQVLGCD